MTTDTMKVMTTLIVTVTPVGRGATDIAGFGLCGKTMLQLQM